MCISFTKTHPRLDPFQNDTNIDTDCAAILGHISNTKNAKVQYKTEAIVPVAAGADNLVFATIISLDAEGITEQVDFTLDQLLQ